MRIAILALLAALAILASAHQGHARNAAGSIGAQHQGASHHANTVSRHQGAPVFSVPMTRSGPMVDAYGQIIRVPAQSSATRDAPELSAILRNPNASSELRYRAELCRVLPNHSEQLACFNH